MYNQENQWCVQVILTLIFSCGYFALPTEKVNEMIFKVENLDEVKEYQIAEKDFDNDYDKDNPATRAEALEKGKNI